MKIVVRVDQAACFGRGLNASTSTAVVEIDPSKLETKICKYIAKHMRDGVQLDLSLAVPTPTAKDIEAAVKACLQMEEARLANEAVFEEFLSAENLRLYREGRLADLTRLKTNLKVIEPLLKEIRQIKPPEGCILTSAVLKSLGLRKDTNSTDIILVANLATLECRIEPVPAELPAWLDILNEDWLPFLQQVEAKGIHIQAIQQRLAPPTDQIRLNLTMNTMGLQADINLSLIGTTGKHL